MKNILLLVCASFMLFGCGAGSHFFNKNYTANQYAVKPILVYPIKDTYMKRLAIKDFRDDFNVTKEQGPIDSIAADTLYHYLTEAVRTSVPHLAVTGLQSEDGYSTYAMKSVQYSVKRYRDFLFSIPDKKQIKNWNHEIVLFVKNVRFDFVKFSFGSSYGDLNPGFNNVYGGGSQNTNGGSVVNTQPSTDFSLQYDYLLYDYSKEKCIAYGVARRQVGAELYVSRGDWMSLIDGSIKDVLNTYY